MNTTKQFRISTIAFAIVAISAGMSNSAHATVDDNNWHQPKPKEETKPTQPVANGGTGTGYGGQADAASAASAISNALAKNDNKFVGELWSKLDANQKTEVANNLKLTNDQKNQFSGAVTGANWTAIGDVGSSSEANGNGAGNQTTVGATNVRSLGLALSFTIPGHNPAPASTAAPVVGVVTTSMCMPDFDPQGNVIRKPIPHEAGTVVEIFLGNGQSRILEGIAKEELIMGKITLVGYGADTEASADSKSDATGFFSLFYSGGKSDSKAKGVTNFKKTDMPCVYRTNYYKAPPPKTEPPVGAAAAGRSDAEASLSTKDTKVPGKVIGERLVKKQTTCNGKPIPDGMACQAIREDVKVLTDADIKLVRVKAEAAAEVKK